MSEVERALLDAAKNPELLKRLARDGANVVAAKFDQQKQIEQLEEIYLRMISDSRKQNR